jgi:hypothetical protein
MKSTHGAPKAIIATAHKIARTVYFLLKDRTEYQDPGAAQYEEKYRQRTIKNLEKKAAKLGMQLVPASTPTRAGAGVS